MLNRLPSRTPSLAEMMHDCGGVTPRQLANAMGVNQRTVYRWMSEGSAPRPVLLALFWLTRWGMQSTDADLFNYATAQRGYAVALKDELSRTQQEVRSLQTQIERLGRLGDFGSANDPAHGVTGPGPVEPALSLTFACFELGDPAPHSPAMQVPVKGAHAGDLADERRASRFGRR